MSGVDRKYLLASLGVVFGLTLWRVVFLAFNGTDLFVDETQYWFWGQNLDFGYYSKPPMIGWLIRGVTDLAGSDAAFWIRVPAPILHMFSALILMHIADQNFDRKTALWVGPCYVALPLVTVGSALMSTDTVMLPFFAIALWAYFGNRDQDRIWLAVLMGAAIGFGLMSKYAAIYFVIGVALAALGQKSRRMSPLHVLAAVIAGLVVFVPNIWWNLNNEATTVRHTLDNANWQGGLHFDKALEFFGAQFLVVGPVLFGALIWAVVRAFTGKLRGEGLTLVVFSVPIVALVVGQALMSQAYANWAVAAYIAGTILAVWMIRTRLWLLWLALVPNLALALALPVMMVNPQTPVLGNGEAMFARYLGRAALSERIYEVARSSELDVIVAQNRDVLADLFHTLNQREIAVYARPPIGHVPNSYYEQRFALPVEIEGPIAFMTFSENAPCADAIVLERWEIASGAYAGREAVVFVLDGACLQEGGNDP